jgi:sugar lactone lactonase YvrE
MALAVGLTTMAGAAATQEKGGGDETGPYDVVANWPTPLHTDFTWGRTPAVWAQSSNKVFVLQSAELPVLQKPIGTGGVPVRPAEGAPSQRFEHLLMMFDSGGRLLDSWEQHNALFSHSHRIAVDPRDAEMNVWIADNTQHQVFKFTNDGKKLLVTIGEAKVRGSGADHLASPSDIAFMKNGDVLITDPGNSRVARFTRDGKFVSQFGAAGKGPGQFGGNLHGISVDAKERIYVADRGNSRIQVFDKEGKFVDAWPGVRFPCFVGVDKDQAVWVADALTNKILKFDTSGRLLYSWGTFGGEPGQMWGPHHLSTDEQGNLYVTEVWGGRVQKFTPKKGADKSKLVGQLFWK